NYQRWVVRMKAYLLGQGLWEAVTSGELPQAIEHPTPNQLKIHEERVARYHRALDVIFSSVDEHVFSRIMHCDSAKKAWEQLQDAFQGSTKTREMDIITLKREFEGMRMKDLEN
ncbi:hypothetical protein M569_14059, partial [Genlisea aurea]